MLLLRKYNSKILKPCPIQSNLYKHLLPQLFCTAVIRQSSKNFDNLDINANIKQSLIKNGFESLSKAQSLALPKILEQKNTIIHAEPGSGKTLSYVIPILNHIFSRSKSKKHLNEEMKGAIIVAPTKEICIQIYSFFRILDPQNLAQITRAGSLSHFVPIVPYLDQNSPENIVREVAFKSIVSTVEWKTLDILITTPSQLESILEAKDKTDAYNVNPKYIVFDEYDLLLGEEGLAKPCRNVLRRFAGVHKSLFGEKNKERQFIFCGSYPLKRSVGEELKNSIDSLEVVQTDDFQKLCSSIKYSSNFIQKQSNSEEELDTLLDVVNSSSGGQKIIFCTNSMRVKLVYDFLTKHQYKCLPFYANLPTEERINVISRFKNNQFEVLITTDLISRGITLQNVNHVIQFDFALNAAGVFLRAGCIGQHRKDGWFTSFVRERDGSLASKFKEIVENENDLSTSELQGGRSSRKKGETGRSVK